MKNEDLKEWMNRLGIREEDLIEKFVLGSGRGGQKINKTSSCVYLKHLPSGIEVKCQKERSRALNRLHARQELCERIARRRAAVLQEKQDQIEKARRQKRRRTRSSQEKVLEAKKRHSTKKGLRRFKGED